MFPIVDPILMLICLFEESRNALSHAYMPQVDKMDSTQQDWIYKRGATVAGFVTPLVPLCYNFIQLGYPEPSPEGCPNLNFSPSWQRTFLNKAEAVILHLTTSWEKMMDEDITCIAIGVCALLKTGPELEMLVTHRFPAFFHSFL